MKSPHEIDSIFQFGVFEVDFHTGELRKAGLRVRLQGQPLEVLRALLEHPGELVTREELQRRLWTGVSYMDKEHGLNLAVQKLRETLGDSADNPRFIETLPRRGYRFIAQPTGYGPEPAHTREGADTEPAHKATSLSKSSYRWWWTTGAVVMALATIGLALYWRPGAALPARSPSFLTPIPLVTLPGAAESPAFSPNGNEIVYVYRAPGEQLRAPGKLVGNLYILPIGGQQARQLTSTGAAFPAWSPDGQQIAFARWKNSRWSIWTVPAAGGTEQKLVDVQWGTHFGKRLSFSPDGEILAYPDNDGQGAYRSAIVLLSLRTMKTRILTHPPEAFMFGDVAPMFSPDGSRIGFLRFSAYSTGEIYTVSPNGTGLLQVTAENAGIASFDWSEDGKAIVFASPRSTGHLWTFGLWRISASGGSPELLPITSEVQRPATSRIGNRLAFAQRATLQVDLYSVSLGDPSATPTPVVTSSRVQANPQFSPDGKRITFASDRSGAGEIWTADADGRNVNQETFLARAAGSPQWSPDSRSIVFDTVVDGHSKIFIVDQPRGSPRQLTDCACNDVMPTWSHDGRWIYFTSNRTGMMQIWKMSPAGGTPLQITKQGGLMQRESLDGASLYYLSPANQTTVWRVPVGGGSETSMFNREHSGSFRFSYWAVARTGMDYLEAHNGKVSVKRHRVADGKEETISTLPQAPGWAAQGITISPDERTMIYTQAKPQQSNIMLIENFR